MKSDGQGTMKLLGSSRLWEERTLRSQMLWKTVQISTRTRTSPLPNFQPSCRNSLHTTSLNGRKEGLSRVHMYPGTWKTSGRRRTSAISYVPCPIILPTLLGNRIPFYFNDANISHSARKIMGFLKPHKDQHHRFLDSVCDARLRKRSALYESGRKGAS